MKINGFLLLLPFLLVRFGLLFHLSKDALRRAAHFPAGFRGKSAAYWSYQLSTVGIFLSSCFLAVPVGKSLWFWGGAVVYGAGLVFCGASMIDFADPTQRGLKKAGLYRFSRNPMYVSYFICFTGCAMLTRSLVLLGFAIVFQIAGHWLVLAEEEWCLEQFGEEYRQYMREVRRYI